ncbi:MAG TPA: ABC transporter ATP-binding protein, partial [Propionibacteriaceae bacterium]|nr:ABC transporter ATP-binding protein [Propionibacteriaceae bacterium]
MSADLLSTSAETWREEAASVSRVPELLTVHDEWPVRKRIPGLWQRHALRQQRAEDFYAASRNPARGLPVAENTAVVGFVGGLLSTRKMLAFWLVALNAAAGFAGLIVPRILGQLIDRASAGGDELAST